MTWCHYRRTELISLLEIFTDTLFAFRFSRSICCGSQKENCVLDWNFCPSARSLSCLKFTPLPTLMFHVKPSVQTSISRSEGTAWDPSTTLWTAQYIGAIVLRCPHAKARVYQTLALTRRQCMTVELCEGRRVEDRNKRWMFLGCGTSFPRIQKILCYHYCGRLLPEAMIYHDK